MHRTVIHVNTRGRGLVDITAQLREAVRESAVVTGLCHCFIQHTSASLTVQENADPNVLRDLDAWMSRLVTDGDPLFQHTEEGPDDMSAHIRCALTDVAVTVPVHEGALALGTWQAVYLWEHRTSPKERRVLVTVY